eukprot:gnl/MRDRNA2_/MRDRNA2_75490_c0_seq1.p1 gnl/MRDRNA2_/MRDRNA2_75490_c0~~gnl/MRDRNA2_/MRDRNA2_75490_c0_seq1.p1  ORF type:complete len:238 (+),score=22.22 gnl/MRDRNA2_/MRDRNA2_75490_c0_seq1:78-791(+)
MRGVLVCLVSILARSDDVDLCFDRFRYDEEKCAEDTTCQWVNAKCIERDKDASTGTKDEDYNEKQNVTVSCSTAHAPGKCQEHDVYDSDCCAEVGAGSCADGYVWSKGAARCGRGYVGSEGSCCIPPERGRRRRGRRGRGKRRGRDEGSKSTAGLLWMVIIALLVIVAMLVSYVCKLHRKIEQLLHAPRQSVRMQPTNLGQVTQVAVGRPVASMPPSATSVACGGVPFHTTERKNSS